MRRPRLLGPALSVALFFTASACQTSAPNSPSEVTQGNQYAHDGLYREAVDAYRKALAIQPNDPTAHRNLGIVYVKIGNYKAAADQLEKSLQRFDNNYEANYYLGEAYRGLGTYADAIYHYQKAIKLKPNDSKTLKALAWSYFKIRFYSQALATTQTLVKLTPHDDQAAIILARVQLKLKLDHQALTTVRNAEAAAPKSSQPYLKSVEGDVLFDMGDQEGATRTYRSALQAQPLMAGALLGLGRCLLTQGKTRPAITLMERAVRIRPTMAEAHYFLGKAYEGIDRDKSLRYYQYFRKQAATDPEFLSELTEVKQRMSRLESKKSAN